MTEMLQIIKALAHDGYFLFPINLKVVDNEKKIQFVDENGNPSKGMITLFNKMNASEKRRWFIEFISNFASKNDLENWKHFIAFGFWVIDFDDEKVWKSWEKSWFASHYIVNTFVTRSVRKKLPHVWFLHSKKMHKTVKTLKSALDKKVDVMIRDKVIIRNNEVKELYNAYNNSQILSIDMVTAPSGTPFVDLVDLLEKYMIPTAGEKVTLFRAFKSVYMKGMRHNFVLAVANWWRKNALPRDDLEKLIDWVCATSNEIEPNDRMRVIQDVYELEPSNLSESMLYSFFSKEFIKLMKNILVGEAKKESLEEFKKLVYEELREKFDLVIQDRLYWLRHGDVWLMYTDVPDQIRLYVHNRVYEGLGKVAESIVNSIISFYVNSCGIENRHNLKIYESQKGWVAGVDGLFNVRNGKVVNVPSFSGIFTEYYLPYRVSMVEKLMKEEIKSFEDVDKLVKFYAPHIYDFLSHYGEEVLVHFYNFMADTLAPFQMLKKIYFVYGGSNTGKSTLFGDFVEFVINYRLMKTLKEELHDILSKKKGYTITSNPKILRDNRFYGIYLIDKLSLLIKEKGATMLDKETIENLKAFSGRDSLTVEFKGKNTLFTFTPTCSICWIGNGLPLVDMSNKTAIEGFKERVYPIRMSKKFDVEVDVDVVSELEQYQEEVYNFVSLMLVLAHKIYKNRGFIFGYNKEKAQEEFFIYGHEEMKMIHDNFRFAVGGKIPMDVMRAFVLDTLGRASWSKVKELLKNWGVDTRKEKITRETGEFTESFSVDVFMGIVFKKEVLDEIKMLQDKIYVDGELNLLDYSRYAHLMSLSPDMLLFVIENNERYMKYSREISLEEVFGK